MVSRLRCSTSQSLLGVVVASRHSILHERQGHARQFLISQEALASCRWNREDQDCFDGTAKVWDLGRGGVSFSGLWMCATAFEADVMSGAYSIYLKENTAIGQSLT